MESFSCPTALLRRPEPARPCLWFRLGVRASRLGPQGGSWPTNTPAPGEAQASGAKGSIVPVATKNLACGERGVISAAGGLQVGSV